MPVSGSDEDSIDTSRLPYPGPPQGGSGDETSELAARIERRDAEIARLRADNEALRQATVELGTKGSGQPGRTKRVFRRIGAATLIVLALLFGVVGNVAVWVKDVALDTNEFEAVVGPLSKDPAVAEAVSVAVVDELLTATDARTRSQEALDEFLPSDVQFLSGAIVSAVEDTLTNAVQELIESDQFNTLWRQVTALAHEQLVSALLTDNSDAVLQQQGAEVVLDLRPIIEAAQGQLPADGIGGAISSAPIPEDAGVFKITDSSALGEARDAAQLLDLLGTWLPIIAIALLLGGIALAYKRRQATIVSMVAFAVLMLLTLLALRIARSTTLSQLDVDETTRRAAGVVWDAAVEGLRGSTIVLLVAAILVAIGAWVSGSSQPAVAIRRWVVHAIARARQHGGITLGDNDPIGQIVRPNKNAFRIGGVALALIVLVLIPGLSILDLVLAVIFLLLYLGAIEIVAPGRKGRAEDSAVSGDERAGADPDDAGP
jgi:hypothetical protein